MDLQSRIGPDHADVIIFNKGGRDVRLERLNRGEEAPREFFYGFFELEKNNISAAMMSTATAVPGLVGMFADRSERAFAALTSLGVRPVSMRLLAPVLAGAEVAISYTDGFSLSLGLGCPRRSDHPVLIGGFHGLSDIELRSPRWARTLVRALIRKSLARLDHVFFFGPGDRQVAIEHYGLTPERSSIFPFGVDTEYWRPMPDETTDDFVVAVGQDASRDYDLLAAAPGEHPIHIVTRRKVKVPTNAVHIKITTGDYFNSKSMGDLELRRLYNQACAVVVPLKDVYQPTGYSVTLQAMSCGRPVILSNIKGLWTQTLLRDGENCLLVPPGDARALSEAIGRIRFNRDLAIKLGRKARDTAINHYGLDRMGAGSVELARLGFTMRAARPRVHQASE